MNTEALIREAVRRTIKQTGCDSFITWNLDDGREKEVFENRVIYHYNAIQLEIKEARERWAEGKANRS